MMKLVVSHKGEQCAVHADGQLLFHASWETFDEIVRAMRRIARRETTFERGGAIEIRAEGESAVLSVGRWSSACTLTELSALALGMNDVARMAESTNNTVLSKQVLDGALLARVGLPFGLSNNPRVKDAVANAAATDTTLRRAIPFPKVARIPGVPVVKHISNLAALQLLHAQNEQMKKDLYGET